MLNGDNVFSETGVSGVSAVIEPKSWYDRSIPRHLRKRNLQHVCLESWVHTTSR